MDSKMIVDALTNERMWLGILIFYSVIVTAAFLVQRSLIRVLKKHIRMSSNTNKFISKGLEDLKHEINKLKNPV